MPLFDDEGRGLVRNDHPDTAHEAAARAPDTKRDRERVLALIRQRERAGATDEELQDWLDMNPSTERPRRVELVRAQLVYNSGRKRLTTSGRRAIVWVAT